jgi:hypothetical protein
VKRERRKEFTILVQLVTEEKKSDLGFDYENSPLIQQHTLPSSSTKPTSIVLIARVEIHFDLKRQLIREKKLNDIGDLFPVPTLLTSPTLSHFTIPTSTFALYNYPLIKTDT